MILKRDEGKQSIGGRAFNAAALVIPAADAVILLSFYDNLSRRHRPVDHVVHC